MTAPVRADGKPPLLALINNVQTPYRVHLHRRIVREMPEVRIASLYTHDQADQPWESQRVDEINPVRFGRDQPVLEQGFARWFATDWRKASRIMEWLRVSDARAVVLGGYSDITRLRIIRWCRRAGIPCFVFADSNIHGDTVTGLKKLVKSVLVQWVVRNAAGLMPCGTLGRAFFERYGAARDRCFFVPYEPDYDLIRALPEESIAKARADFGLDPSRSRIVVCARLVPVKRVDLAIAAFAAIAAERPDWDLVIIGDGPLRDRLRAGVPAALHGRVIWTGFIGEQSRISAIYRASHLLLCPSDYEPWAVVINEAAAAGLAIVASSVVGAAAELVQVDVNGGTFPVGDLAALTECLRGATAPGTTPRLRQGSAQVLADWRRRGDPIQGIRSAIRASGVLSDNVPQQAPDVSTAAHARS